MIEETFDPNALREQLLGLSPQKRLAFALACSERLYPNYVAFFDEEGWGNPKVLRTALDLAWDALSGQPPSPQLIRRIRKQVQDAEPDTEEHGTALASAALDAAAAAGLALEMLETDDPKVAVEIASLGRDTVDMHVQVIEDLDPNAATSELVVLRHRLMQEELGRQRDDLRTLSDVAWTPVEVARIIGTWRNLGVSNIGRSARLQSD